MAGVEAGGAASVEDDEPPWWRDVDGELERGYQIVRRLDQADCGTLVPLEQIMFALTQIKGVGRR